MIIKLNVVTILWLTHMLCQGSLHISQKPKDLLPIVNEPSQILTILSNNKAENKGKKCT